MLARVFTAALIGIEARLVEVQVDTGTGLPVTRTLGLPDSAIRESAERIRSAIRNSGFEFPPRRITVNLAPADLPKSGSGFDLPVALGVMLANAGGPAPAGGPLDRYLWAAELTLEGALRPVRGILPIALAARRLGLAGVVTAPSVATEAALVGGVDSRAARTLSEAFAFARGVGDLPRAIAPGTGAEAAASPPGSGAEGTADPPGSAPDGDPFSRAGARLSGPSGSLRAPGSPDTDETPDMADVRGQAMGRRALEIAAAGGHNLLFIGPPGGGKTMLARRMPGILPPLGSDEALEVSCLYSVAGLLPPGAGLIRRAPFRAPHHSATEAAIAGGGAVPRPGEASLSSGGVLFLDELPEFPRRSLESLRQPIEEGLVRVVRSRVTVSYPARFLLMAAMNPCPCGFLGDERRPCLCQPGPIARYRSRVSGPLLDRIDLHVWLPALPPGALADRRAGEGSGPIRERVAAARRRQQVRQGCTNGRLGPRALADVARPALSGEKLLASAMERFGLSARAYHRILRVARTIADLEGVERVRVRDIAEAVQYRVLDRRAEAAGGHPTVSPVDRPDDISLHGDPSPEP